MLRLRLRVLYVKLRISIPKSNARTVETEGESTARKAMNKESMSKARTVETEAESTLRKAKDKHSKSKTRIVETEAESTLRKAKDKHSKSRKRARETCEDNVDRKAKNKCSMATMRARIKPIDAVIDKFMAKVRIGPEYVCTSCHRMLYRHSVVPFKPSKYTKDESELIDKLSQHECVSNIDGKKWVCKTCDGSLSRGVLPVQAKANGMELDDQPDELTGLNPLEKRLIALRVPFMIMVALPTGKQKCIHGPVNVPSKVDTVCEILPRLPSECELVPLKLKRKLSYKGHYLYDYVSPEKLSNALRWLKANNPLYANIKIVDDWVENAIANDEELVMTMLEQDEPMDDSDTSGSPQPMEVEYKGRIW